jgi:hypothetical protein
MSGRGGIDRRLPATRPSRGQPRCAMMCGKEQPPRAGA